MICKSCDTDKPADAFRQWRKSCKACESAAVRARQIANPERTAASIAAWRAANPDKVRKHKADSYERVRDRDPEAHAQKMSAAGKRVRELFPERKAAYEGKRRARKYNATPAWANEFFMEEAYALAKLRTQMTGIPWEVDHVVPLQGKTVCGLHTHSNLAVIPMRINCSKNNRYWPDMPERN